MKEKTLFFRSVNHQILQRNCNCDWDDHNWGKKVIQEAAWIFKYLEGHVLELRMMTFATELLVARTTHNISIGISKCLSQNYFVFTASPRHKWFIAPRPSVSQSISWLILSSHVDVVVMLCFYPTIHWRSDRDTGRQTDTWVSCVCDSIIDTIRRCVIHPLVATQFVIIAPVSVAYPVHCNLFLLLALSSTSWILYQQQEKRDSVLLSHSDCEAKDIGQQCTHKGPSCN